MGEMGPREFRSEGESDGFVSASEEVVAVVEKEEIRKPPLLPLLAIPPVSVSRFKISNGREGCRVRPEEGKRNAA